MRAILAMAVTVAAMFGIALLALAIHEGSLEQAGRIVDREIEDAGSDARRALDQVGTPIEHGIDGPMAGEPSTH